MAASAQYSLEPMTRGRVVLETTAGAVSVDLWPQQAPLTVRNFCQLVCDGRYDGTLFHRVVAGALVQGGDPTGTGEGGASSFEGGAGFKDELHSRMQFRGRGMVAMANRAPGTSSNASQFFITLAATPWLNGRNTIFGAVRGDALFNVLKIGEGPVGADERPLEPHRVLRGRIVEQPFDEPIVPRAAPVAAGPARAPARRSVMDDVKAERNANLLSFGGDEEEAAAAEEAGEDLRKFRSVHDAKRRREARERGGEESGARGRAGEASEASAVAGGGEPRAAPERAPERAPEPERVESVAPSTAAAASGAEEREPAPSRALDRDAALAAKLATFAAKRKAKAG